MVSKFNFKKFCERNMINVEYQKQLEELERQKSLIYIKKENFKSNCTHDLIVHFGKCGPFEPDTGYAECICCGTTFHLKDEEYLESINPDNVLDLVGRVPETNFYTLCRGENILITRIKENLLNTFENELPIEEIKKRLIADLILYTEEKERATEERLARIKNKKNK